MHCRAEGTSCGCSSVHVLLLSRSSSVLSWPTSCFLRLAGLDADKRHIRLSRFALMSFSCARLGCGQLHVQCYITAQGKMQGSMEKYIINDKILVFQRWIYAFIINYFIQYLVQYSTPFYILLILAEQFLRDSFWYSFLELNCFSCSARLCLMLLSSVALVL